jgi:DNA-binding beta-propeller fold protein YncE
MSRRTTIALGAGVVVLAAAIVAVVVIAGHRSAAPQVVLPFAGLHYPFGVAVDPAGDLYAADGGNNRVLQLAAG